MQTSNQIGNSLENLGKTQRDNLKIKDQEMDSILKEFSKPLPKESPTTLENGNFLLWAIREEPLSKYPIHNKSTYSALCCRYDAI
jgi:hypothetical protein